MKISKKGFKSWLKMSSVALPVVAAALSPQTSEIHTWITVMELTCPAVTQRLAVHEAERINFTSYTEQVHIYKWYSALYFNFYEAAQIVTLLYKFWATATM